MARTGTALVTLAALCWGLSGGIAAMLMADGWGAFVVSFYRGAVGLLFVLAWLALYHRHSGLGHPRLWFWSALAGLGVAGNFSFYFVSIGEGNIAVAATLMYCAPVFVYLVSFLLKLEKPCPAKFSAIALVMLGIALLTEIYDVGAGVVTPVAVGAGLLSAVSYALFLFAFKYAAPWGSPQAVLAIAFGVFVAVLVWPASPAGIMDVPASSQWPLFLALGVLGAGISFILYVVGLFRTAPAVASVVAMVEPVTASLFGVVVLSQTLSPVQLLGMVLILGAVTFLASRSKIRRMPRRRRRYKHGR
jgi:DME family drug/metabolite transporter